MPISILPPKPPPPSTFYNANSSHDASLFDADSDTDMPDPDLPRPSKRARTGGKSIVTPGESITDDPQWMRGHGTFAPPSLLSPSGGSIHASLAGTVSRTNKLLSVSPLRSRYTPEIGDLVVGRIVEVQTKRWKVDLSAPLLATLPLSAVNLPGGILRKRTATDELQIRNYFSEGDLLIAEVQSVHADGAASLHTRSLKYGKLRNGVFLSVAGMGGGRGGGVVRSRRQVWTVSTGNGGGEVDVVLGVNGYVWIAKHSREVAEGEGGKASITRLEEQVSSSVYSSQNEEVGGRTRREIARLGGVIMALVEGGCRVDEEMVMRGYEASLEVEMDQMDVGLDGQDYLGGEKGARVVGMALAAARA